MLESELKRFQSNLRKNRPKFRGPYTCSRKMLASSNDDEFWSGLSGTRKKEIEKLRCLESLVTESRNENAIELQAAGLQQQVITKIDENAYPCPITVTIKDKPITESRDEQLELMRIVFEAIRRNVVLEKQLQELRVKVQDRITKQRLQRTFRTWRNFVDNAKIRAQRRKDGKEMSKERKIELFVNAISEKQKELAKIQNKTISADVRCTKSAEAAIPGQISLKKIPSLKMVPVVEPPAHNRLNAQRKIIAEQRAKLAEQNRIIEDLKLKQIEKETKNSSKDTINVAKDVLAHCGGRTRRTLVKLMREEGCK